MAVNPIICRAHEVRAMLDGRQTQLRRIVNPQPAIGCSCIEPHPDFRNEWAAFKDGEAQHSFALSYAEGDLLWARETWKPHSLYAHMKPRDVPQTNVFFKADSKYAPSNTPWVPSIHMPRWASRLTLRVTDVRVQRLQDITSADSIAQGIMPAANSQTIDCDTPNPRDGFQSLWQSIYGPESWEDNPWVMACSFEALLGNVAKYEAEMS